MLKVHDAAKRGNINQSSGVAAGSHAGAAAGCVRSPLLRPLADGDPPLLPMPPSKRCRSSCLSAIEVCCHSCLPTNRRLTRVASEAVLVEGDAARPLAPNGDPKVRGTDGEVSSLGDGRNSGSGRGSIVLSQGGCLSGFERLQMQLAIGCLRMLSTTGHQGPVEGSVLGGETEDDTR